MTESCVNFTPVSFVRGVLATALTFSIINNKLSDVRLQPANYDGGRRLQNEHQCLVAADKALRSCPDGSSCVGDAESYLLECFGVPPSEYCREKTLKFFGDCNERDWLISNLGNDDRLHILGEDDCRSKELQECAKNYFKSAFCGLPYNSTEEAEQYEKDLDALVESVCTRHENKVSPSPSEVPSGSFFPTGFVPTDFPTVAPSEQQQPSDAPTAAPEEKTLSPMSPPETEESKSDKGGRRSEARGSLAVSALLLFGVFGVFGGACVLRAVRGQEVSQNAHGNGLELGTGLELPVFSGQSA